MQLTRTKNPPERVVCASVGAGLDRRPWSGYLGDANQQDRNSLASPSHLAKAKFLLSVKIWQGRRSFRAVGESCVTNLIPDPKPCNDLPCQHGPSIGNPVKPLYLPIGDNGLVLPKGTSRMKKRYTKKQRLDYYIKQQKKDLIKTLGRLEYLKRYEPDVYRKMMDRGC